MPKRLFAILFIPCLATGPVVGQIRVTDSELSNNGILEPCALNSALPFASEALASTSAAALYRRAFGVLPTCLILAAMKAVLFGHLALGQAVPTHPPNDALKIEVLPGDDAVDILHKDPAAAPLWEIVTHAHNAAHLCADARETARAFFLNPDKHSGQLEVKLMEARKALDQAHLDIQSWWTLSGYPQGAVRLVFKWTSEAADAFDDAKKIQRQMEAPEAIPRATGPTRSGFRLIAGNAAYLILHPKKNGAEWKDALSAGGKAAAIEAVRSTWFFWRFLPRHKYPEVELRIQTEKLVDVLSFALHRQRHESWREIGDEFDNYIRSRERYARLAGTLAIAEERLSAVETKAALGGLLSGPAYRQLHDEETRLEQAAQSGDAAAFQRALDKMTRDRDLLVIGLDVDHLHRWLDYEAAEQKYRAAFIDFSTDYRRLQENIRDWDALHITIRPFETPGVVHVPTPLRRGA